jgi:hypothetical protein
MSDKIKTFKVAGFPAIVLNNGLTVVNYSSPHPYTFDTGEVLPACDQDLVKKHSLKEEHLEEKNPNGWIDVRIKDKIQHLQMDSLVMIAKNPKVNVILVPYRVKVALYGQGSTRGVRDLYEDHGNGSFTDGWSAKSYCSGDIADMKEKARVCRIEDRLNKLVSSTKFCK